MNGDAADRQGPLHAGGHWRDMEGLSHEGSDSYLFSKLRLNSDNVYAMGSSTHAPFWHATAYTAAKRCRHSSLYLRRTCFRSRRIVQSPSPDAINCRHAAV